jgi:pimeloyl-ACP methyl ester carboxylesterase
MMEFNRERSFTASDGLPLFFRDYGNRQSSAAPLLCLSGLTRNSQDFDAIGWRYGAERRVICPDYRGRGRSAHDPDWRNYRPEIYLDDIRSLLASLNIHRVVVIGTSLGGLLAMGMSVLMPGVLAAAVLNDVGPDLAKDGMIRILDYVGRDRPQPDWESAVATVKTLFPGLAEKNDEAAWRKAAEATFREQADGTFRFNWDVRIVNNLRAAPPIPDLWPLFRALSPRPVLAIRGALSDVLSAGTFERMQLEMPSLEQYTLNGCGHAPALDEPELLDVLDAFIARF